MISKRERKKLIDKLERSKYDGGFVPASFAAMMLVYIDMDAEERVVFESEFPEVFDQ